LFLTFTKPKCGHVGIQLSLLGSHRPGKEEQGDRSSEEKNKQQDVPVNNTV
jgi:hypothetical protein